MQNGDELPKYELPASRVVLNAGYIFIYFVFLKKGYFLILLNYHKQSIVFTLTIK